MGLQGVWSFLGAGMWGAGLRAVDSHRAVRKPRDEAARPGVSLKDPASGRSTRYTEFAQNV